MAAKTKSVDVTLEALLEAGAHFGHQVKRWNPKMEEYIYGARDGVHIFDLAKTREALLVAMKAIEQATKEGKRVLILGTKKQISGRVKELADEVGVAYVNERWLGGTITNFTQMKKSIRNYLDIKENLAAGGFEDLTKKEKLLLNRDLEKMERKFGGLVNLTDTPEFLIIIDTKKEQSAVKEALTRDIAVVGVVDTNGDPTQIDFPIPMNDDATKALELVLDLIAQAIARGKGGVKKTVDEKQKPAKKVKK